MSKVFRALVGAERYEEFQTDPVDFVRAFSDAPWEFQEDILRRALSRKDGKFDHRFVVISLPRQNGKSTLSAWIGLYQLFCDAEEQEILSIANDTDQSRIILNDARKIIRSNSILYECLDKQGLTQSEIRLRDGRRWQIKSSQHVSSRGLRPTCVLYDELGWASSSELFDALTASQAAQANPLFVCTSTVGPARTGPLWGLFEAAKDDDPDILLIYHEENLSPLITEEFLEGQRRKLPPTIFAREHMNQWGVGGDAFASLEAIEHAINYGPALAFTDAGPSVLFCDLGWVHDETAIAVAKWHEESGLARVIALETFKGSQAEPVQLKRVQERIIEMAGMLGVTQISIESPQGVLMSEQLKLEGLPASVSYPTSKGQMAIWGSLYSALRNGRVWLPDDHLLKQQLLSLTIKSTTTGWRVEDVASLHQDRAIACAGAIHMLGSSFGISWAELVSEYGDNKLASRWALTGSAQSKPEPLYRQKEKALNWGPTSRSRWGGTRGGRFGKFRNQRRYDARAFAPKS